MRSKVQTLHGKRLLTLAFVHSVSLQRTLIESSVTVFLELLIYARAPILCSFHSVDVTKRV